MKMRGKMNSYSIEIKETVVRCINVIAASEFEAIEKAAREYRCQGSPQNAYGYKHGYESIDFKVIERRKEMACKEYEVEVRETLSRKVKVTAENEELAVSEVEDMYYCSEIILDAEDYVGVEYLNVKEIDDYGR